MGGDWGRGSRACEQSAAVSAVRGVPQAPAFRWQPLPVSGCHLVSLGRRAGRMGLQDGPAGSQHRQGQPESIPKQPGCGTPTLGSAWVRDPRARDSGQHGCRPQRRTSGKRRAQSSRWCQGWLRGPWSSQGLKAQQPHRWPGVVAGVLVKEEGDHHSQQCAGCLQGQHGQPQGQGHLALPWAGPQGPAPGTMTAGGQGWGGWTGACAV